MWRASEQHKGKPIDLEGLPSLRKPPNETPLSHNWIMIDARPPFTGKRLPRTLFSKEHSSDTPQCALNHAVFVRPRSASSFPPGRVVVNGSLRPKRKAPALHRTTLRRIQPVSRVHQNLQVLLSKPQGQHRDTTIGVLLVK